MLKNNFSVILTTMFLLLFQLPLYTAIGQEEGYGEDIWLIINGTVANLSGNSLDGIEVIGKVHYSHTPYINGIEVYLTEIISNEAVTKANGTFTLSFNLGKYWYNIWGLDVDIKDHSK